jgi:lipoate-protein ligase A
MTPPWRCLIDGSRDETAGARNMAIDEALHESVLAGGPPVLRLYRWSPPCLSFGRNQAARGVWDVVRARTAGIDIVRRPTGGLAVLHHRELTYAVAVPTALLRGPRATFLALHTALLAGLQRIGVAASLAPTARAGARPAATHPCFAERAGGEIVARGRKLVGSAQRADRHALLQHGSILIESDQSLVAALQTVRAADPADDGAIGLATLLGRAPDPGELVEAVRAGFEQVLGIRLCASVLTGEEQARVAQLERHYGADTWTWRR